MKQGNNGRDPFWFTALAYVGLVALTAIMLVMLAIALTPQR